MDTQFSTMRTHIRLKLNEGIKANLRLLDNQGLLLTGSTAPVILLNMSQSGLCFFSGLKLPLHKGYMVDFDVRITGILLNLRGHIVWREKKDSVYEYGVAFHPPNRLRTVIIRILNQEILRQSPGQFKIHQLYRKLNQDMRKVREGSVRGTETK